MINKARIFAEKAHQGQSRKITNAPYINHPLRVAKRLQDVRSSDELVCAAYLHDVVEDTPFEIEDIESLFGPRIASIVAAHTEDKSKSWKERKQHTIDTVKVADKEVKYLIVADRLDNLLDFEKDLKQFGDTVWDNFNAGYDDQKWYNESIVNHMCDALNENDIPMFFREYEQAVKRVFS